MKLSPLIGRERKLSEHLEQVTAVRWFRDNYPGVLIFSIPNGGFRHKAVAEKMRLEGAVPGIPDLMIPAWRLFVEMKAETGGRLSPAQKEQIAYLESVGYRCLVCHGFESFRDAIIQLPPAPPS